MNESEKKLSPEINWSKISFLFVIIGWGCFTAGVLLVLVFNYLDRTDRSPKEQMIQSFLIIFVGILFFTWLLLNLLGFIIGIIALFQILVKKTFLNDFKKAVAGIILPLLVLIPIFLFVLYVRLIAHRMICGMNLAGLGKAILLYANDFPDKFPEPNKWCDLLIEKEDVGKKQFSHFHKDSPLRSYYAINPNCNVNCPNDVVLAFETKAGWNQFGGPDLLTFDNHWDKGTNILFNDGRVEWIKPQDVGRLKWTAEDSNNIKLQGEINEP